ARQGRGWTRTDAGTGRHGRRVRRDPVGPRVRRAGHGHRAPGGPHPPRARCRGHRSCGGPRRRPTAGGGRGPQARPVRAWRVSVPSSLSSLVHHTPRGYSARANGPGRHGIPGRCRRSRRTVRRAPGRTVSSVWRVTGTAPPGGRDGPHRPDPHRPALRTVLAGLCVTEIVSWGVLYYAFPVLAPRIVADTGWSNASITAAFSAGLVVAAVVGIPVGRMLDRRGPHVLMSAGSVLAVLALVLIARATSFGAFAVGWIVAGLAMAGV